ALAQPSEREPVRHYASVAPDLFQRIVGRCVEPGRACMDHGKPSPAKALATQLAGQICRGEQDLVL
ncbi:COX aromatic rich motif-containing protein, partial [Bordetella pertussis]